jgi:hypothetical protein
MKSKLHTFIISLITAYTINAQSNFNNTYTVKDFAANKGTGKYSFYNLTNGIEVAVEDSATVKWDIAFSGTNIIFNGGNKGPGNVYGQLIQNTFDDLLVAPTENYTLSNIGGSGSWYNYYSGTNFSGPHTVVPIENKTILIQLENGKYAKIQIINYYQGAPQDVPTIGAPYAGIGKYYTFKYLISESLQEQTTNLLSVKSKYISIYPNPLSKDNSSLTIDSEINNGDLKIVDLLGNTLYSKNINNFQNQISDLNLKQGIYIVMIESNGSLYQQKLLVK